MEFTWYVATMWTTLICLDSSGSTFHGPQQDSWWYLVPWISTCLQKATQNINFPMPYGDVDVHGPSCSRESCWCPLSALPPENGSYFLGENVLESNIVPVPKYLFINPMLRQEIFFFRLRHLPHKRMEVTFVFSQRNGNKWWWGKALQTSSTYFIAILFNGLCL